jgi:molybdopterin/thiamine biosynthesis adenylyltransferase
MTTADSLSWSRPLGVAQHLTGAALDAELVYARRVILTGEPETLRTPNGRWCFTNCLRLLPRVVGDLVVALPQGLGDATQHFRDLAESVWAQRRVKVLPDCDVDFGSAVAVLNVGRRSRPGLPWTSINSNGWVARCSSSAQELPGDVEQPNPLGAMLAASLGTTEVFKRVYGVPTHRWPATDIAQFSLFELSDEFHDCGPALPALLALPDAVLVGAGAIGNGVGLLLAQLPVRGRLVVVDNQVYEPENLGTCCLLDSRDDLSRPKALVLERWLNANSRLSVRSEPSRVGDAVRGDSLKSLSVDLVVNGLDNVDARHDAQSLWPSLIVDGAINSIGAAVVTHSLAQPRWACLRCTFARVLVDDTEARSRATGLHRTSLLGDPTRLLTDADVENARPEAQAWLRQEVQRGATVCSVLPAPKAKSELGIELQGGFRPSVPFIATASAALVMAQVLRNKYWPESRFVHQFQFADLFAGPSTGRRFYKVADSGCLCVRERSTMLHIAQRRRAAPAMSA